MPDTHQERDRLRFNVLCETLSREEFASLATHFTARRYRAGETIMEEETDGEELFLIAAGRVKIAKQSKDGREAVLAILHVGDFFGELELIDGRPRSARVSALEDCTLFTIPDKRFEQLLKTSHAFTFRLLQVLSVRLRALNKHFIKELELSTRQGRKEVLKLERLIEASRTLNSTLDLDRLLGLILDTALHIVDGDRGTVYLVDHAQEEIWSRVLKGDERIEIRLPMGKGIAGYVAATGDTLNIRDAYDDPRFNPEIDRKSGYRTESILCMPMKNNSGKIIGVFQLLNKRAGVFTEEDESFIDALSIHAAIAVENARLYEEEKQKIAMEKDLLAAHEVQMRMIPKVLPRVNGLDVAAVTLPAREVGGDLYDFYDLEMGRLGISLGDVSGKGLAAALVMSNLQATLRNQMILTDEPAECLRRSNRLLYLSTSADRFVTLFHAIVDRASGTLTYCNAGHEPPLLVRAGETSRLACGGVLLGIMDDFPFDQETTQFTTGDVLVIVSDGITEAPDEAGELFGPERVEEIVRRCRERTAEEIKEEIIRAVCAYSGTTLQRDDVTLVVAKALPLAGEQPTRS